jgi:PAT family beta-lactamase induction signal transducer AmpG
VGAIGSGLLLDKMSRKKSAYIAVLLISISAILIGISTALNFILVLGLIWGFAWGFQETVFVALAMDLSETRIAASMFAIMMALSNLGTAIGEGVATSLSDNLGFSTVFISLAVLNVLTLYILRRLFRKAPDLGFVKAR